MVRNTHGGSGHKKFARKHTSGAKNNKLRISEDEGEIYAIVTKMLGNGMFHCFCIDNLTRLGHIRGKFSGRGKRDNMVECGKWILIGLREWDISSSEKAALTKDKKDKLQQCDLLEVYNDSDKQRLKETVSEEWYTLENNDVSRLAKSVLSEESSEFVFVSERDMDRDKLIEEMKSTTTEKISLKISTTEQSETPEDEEINYDDI